MITEELGIRDFKPLNKRSKKKSDYVFWKRPSQTEWEIHPVSEFEEWVLRSWMKSDKMYYAYKK